MKLGFSYLKELLELLVEIFAGEPAPQRFDSDIAIILHPLPRDLVDSVPKRI